MSKKVSLVVQPKYTEYDVVCADSPLKVALMVDDYLNEGWTCQGGIAGLAIAETFSSVKQFYMQAMVR